MSNNVSTEVILNPGDILLVRGKSFMSKVIRFFTRNIGERRTKVNHAGLVIRGGSLDRAVIIEAVNKVKVNNLRLAYGPPRKDKIAIYRATNMTDHELNQVVMEAERYIGQAYGWKRIVFLTLDSMLFGVYLFRRLIRNREPICSWLVARAYSSVGRHFGVGPDSATPDDIWDFVAERPQTPYICVYPLSRLRG